MTEYQRLQAQITFLKNKYACLLANNCCEETPTTPTDMEQNNIFKVITTSQFSGTAVPTISNVATLINTDPQFVVDEIDNIFFKIPVNVITGGNIANLYYVIYKLIGLGKGTYGVGGSPIGEQNLLFDSTTNNLEIVTTAQLPPEVYVLYSSYFTVPQTAVNLSLSTYVIDGTKDYYFQIFNDNRNAIPIPTTEPYRLYRFTGAFGTYGNGGTAAVSGDFLLIDSTVTNTTDPKGITLRTIVVDSIIDGDPLIVNDNISKAVNRSLKTQVMINDHEIVKFSVIRKEVNTLTDTTKDITFVSEKYHWTRGLALIDGDTTLSDFDIEYSKPSTVSIGTGVTGDPKAYALLNDDIAAPHDALNNTVGAFVIASGTEKTYFSVISPEGGANDIKIYEFIGADETYGFGQTGTAVLGDFSEVTQIPDSERVSVTRTSQLFNDGDGVNPFATNDIVTMQAAVYDPTGVNGDAFLMSNMNETTTRKVLTDVERAAIIANTAKISYPAGDSTKVSFINVTQAVDLDTMESDITINNAKNSYPAGDSTKVGYITVTGAINLDNIATQVGINNAKITYPAGDSVKVGYLTVTQAIDLDAIGNNVGDIKTVKVTVPTADMKQLFTTPYQLIPAPGANKVIKIISMTGYLDFNSVAYDFGTDLDIEYATSGLIIYIAVTSDVNAVATRYFDVDKTGPSGGELSVNEAVVLTNNTANATVGNSDVTFVILYVEQDFNV